MTAPELEAARHLPAPRSAGPAGAAGGGARRDSGSPRRVPATAARGRQDRSGGTVHRPAGRVLARPDHVHHVTRRSARACGPRSGGAGRAPRCRCLPVVDAERCPAVDSFVDGIVLPLADDPNVVALAGRLRKREIPAAHTGRRISA